MIDNRTPRNYPLPHPENIAKHDVVRIRESFIAIDADINAIDTVCTQNVTDKSREKFENFIELWSKK